MPQPDFAHMKTNGPAKRRATAEDVAIGQKVRALRLDRGMPQSDLGKLAGVTFQQLKKYEKGANRISAGRLSVIAAALHVPVTAFYEAAARRGDQSFAYLRSKGAVRLVRAYAVIAEHGPKTALVAIAEALARQV
jgi:transcriptional regulator with XRE-family HTH domain